jgi:hypothetical protein
MSLFSKNVLVNTPQAPLHLADWIMQVAMVIFIALVTRLVYKPSHHFAC